MSFVYVFDGYRMDAIRRVLTDSSGNRVEITGKAFDALMYFLEHPGVVIDRSTLLDVLWPDAVVEENNLNQAVAVLRRALGRDYIATVPRRGYQFTAKVQKQSDIVEQPPGRSGSFRLRTRVLVMVAVAAMVVGTYAFFAVIKLAPVGDQTLPKIAVLPCDNLSPNEKDAYLALSLHQEILEQLGKLGGLLVISRSSMMRYAEDRPSVPEIAELLNATAVMECSVRYSAGRVVVTAQLIDPATDSPLWSRSFSGELADIPALIGIQAEIATEVAGVLGVEYLPSERQRLERAPTVSLGAYAEYLKAKQAVTWGGYSLGYSEDDFHRHIDNAIKADAGFALAYSDRALGFLSRSLDAFVAHDGVANTDGSADLARRLLSLARSDAIAALDLDPTLGRAHAVLGAVEYISENQEAGYSHFRRAKELSPNDAEILSFIVGFYLRNGQQAEALELLAHIRRLSPVDRDVGFYFYLAGDRKTALQLLRRMSKLDPVDAYIHSLIGYCLAIDGVPKEAETALRLAEALEREAQEPQSEPSLGMLSTFAYSYGRIGRAADAERLAAVFVRAAESVPVNPMRWVEIHLALNDVDSAYEVAAAVAERPLPPFVSLELDFVLNTYNDPRLEEPRFVELRSTLGGAAFPGE